MSGTATPQKTPRRGPTGNGRPSGVRVADHVGEPAARAAQAVRRAGLRPGLDRSFGCAPHLTGLVVAQDPPAGIELARNGMVTLYVAAPTPEEALEDASSGDPQPPRREAPASLEGHEPPPPPIGAPARRKRRRPGATSSTWPFVPGAPPGERGAPSGTMEPAEHRMASGPVQSAETARRIETASDAETERDWPPPATACQDTEHEQRDASATQRITQAHRVFAETAHGRYARRRRYPGWRGGPARARGQRRRRRVALAAMLLGVVLLTALHTIPTVAPRPTEPVARSTPARPTTPSATGAHPIDVSHRPPMRHERRDAGAARRRHRNSTPASMRAPNVARPSMSAAAAAQPPVDTGPPPAPQQSARGGPFSP